MDQKTVALLSRHRRQQAEERLAAGAAYADHGLVFADPLGLPIRPDHVTKEFPALVRNAGLRSLSLHGLRHTHATLALQAGINPKVVSERLGHARVSLTLDVYSHAIPAMQEEAAEQVASLIQD